MKSCGSPPPPPPLPPPLSLSLPLSFNAPSLFLSLCLLGSHSFYINKIRCSQPSPYLSFHLWFPDVSMTDRVKNGSVSFQIFETFKTIRFDCDHFFFILISMDSMALYLNSDFKSWIIWISCLCAYKIVDSNKVRTGKRLHKHILLRTTRLYYESLYNTLTDISEVVISLAYYHSPNP